MVCILHTVLHHSIDDKWIFFGFLHENLLIFGLCKKISAPGQNQRDERDHSAFGRGCVMRDCRIERNGTVLITDSLRVPRSSECLATFSDYHDIFEETPIYALIRMVLILLFAWSNYLLTNAISSLMYSSWAERMCVA